jgi:transketolase
MQHVREGTDLAIVTMGSVATEAVAAADELARRGINSSVAVVASVRPVPADDLYDLLSSVPLVLTVEAHSVNGGLGSLVAEIIAEADLSCRLVRCGVRSAAEGVSGSNAYWNAAHGLSCDALVGRATSALAGQ